MAGKCGTCTACCKLMGISEIKKPMGEWCPLCKIGTGCKVYDAKPPSCTEYECMWLETQRLPNPMPLYMRPDNLKCVVNLTEMGLHVILDWGRKPVEEGDPLLTIIHSALSTGVKQAIVGLPNSTRKTLYTLNVFGALQREDILMTPTDSEGRQTLIRKLGHG